ncbi:hypothetical protein WHR41_03522 [Cladosporium halotolerans]|uniref:DUF7730 domain-containing protein n=1 Tax=Cladosporium halotolerans TaxID=1052096 RepID=A0AB34KVQ9_9PEZI
MLDALIAQLCFREDAPQELLKPALSKPRTKAAALHNETKSPLLRLPAELRNMIWEDVLSFTTIHIYEDEWKGLKSSICRSKYNDHTYGTADDRTLDSPNSSSTPHQHWNDSYRTQHHPTCRLDTTAAAPSAPSPPNLSLLATCSAIHAETALLPFALNTLSFYHDTSLPPFVRRLAPAQARAIASVALPKAGNFDFGGPGGGGAWRAFAGLRRLSVVVQVAGSGLGACACGARLLLDAFPER